MKLEGWTVVRLVTFGCQPNYTKHNEKGPHETHPLVLILRNHTAISFEILELLLIVIRSIGLSIAPAALHKGSSTNQNTDDHSTFWDS